LAAGEIKTTHGVSEGDEGGRGRFSSGGAQSRDCEA